MKDEKFLILKILVLATALAFSACQRGVAENNNLLSPETLPSVSPTLDLSPAANSDSPIRKVDFKNFIYHMPEDFSESFTLKDGETETTDKINGASLQTVEYGDVTNDGEEEAIISIFPITGGNCSCHMIFIYTLKNQKPNLLWSFDTGDRAEGGLKRVYAENGELIVELFGDDKFENGKWKYDIAEGKFNGLCCPTTFTKFRFKWNGKKFVVAGKPELLDYDWRVQQKKQLNKMILVV